MIRRAAPGLIGESPSPAADDRTPKERRAGRLKKQEALLSSRLEAARNPKATPAERVAAAVAAAVQADPKLQGLSNTAKAARAKLRDQKWREIGGQS